MQKSSKIRTLYYILSLGNIVIFISSIFGAVLLSKSMPNSPWILLFISSIIFSALNFTISAINCTQDDNI